VNIFFLAECKLHTQDCGMAFVAKYNKIKYAYLSLYQTHAHKEHNEHGNPHRWYLVPSTLWLVFIRILYMIVTRYS